MQKEVIQNAKTVSQAVELGAKELGVSAEKVTYVVMQEPSKGFLGIGANEAIVKVIYRLTPADRAEDFIRNLLNNMGLAATVSATIEEDGATVNIAGENMGLLIGRHGEVLDSLQYLATLAANKGLKDYYRITIDVEGYREKRREALRQLAKRMAEKAVKYDRSFALEPMSAYERRIIHTEVQNIKGVSTYSVGNDAERKVIVCPDNKMKKPAAAKERQK
ncbi:MAG: protein jag [Clostridiales bacterium]|jgi:spoIIIJ-associated protein|nr:protein jag [Clostridiales bacterium]